MFCPLSYDMLVSPFPKIPFVPLSNCKKFQIKNMHTNKKYAHKPNKLQLCNRNFLAWWTGAWDVDRILTFSRTTKLWTNHYGAVTTENIEEFVQIIDEPITVFLFSISSSIVIVVIQKLWYLQLNYIILENDRKLKLRVCLPPPLEYLFAYFVN